MFKTYTYLSFIIKTIKIMANVNTILFNKIRCISVKKKDCFSRGFLKEYMPFEMKLLKERNVCVLQLSSKSY